LAFATEAVEFVASSIGCPLTGISPTDSRNELVTIRSALILARVVPDTPTNGPLAELGRDLIRHSAEFPISVAFGLVKQLLLRRSGVIEIVDAEPQEPYGLMPRR
jgi:hypothetical protein